MTREQALKRLEAVRTHGRNAFGYGSRGLYQAGAEDLFRELDAAGAFEHEVVAGGPRAYDLHSPNARRVRPLDGEPKFCIELTPEGARELCDALDVCVREGQGGAVIEAIVEALERQGHDSVELRSLRAELRWRVPR